MTNRQPRAYLHHTAAAVVDVHALLGVCDGHHHLLLADLVLNHPLALLLQLNPAARAAAAAAAAVALAPRLPTYVTNVAQKTVAAVLLHQHGVTALALHSLLDVLRHKAAREPYL
jgi:hypothetical protein